jgi:hypothetical protein
MRILLPIVLALAAVGCKQEEVKREAIVPTPIVMPNHMCSQRGVVAHSKDKPGERMLCELQESLGSHLAKCVCWDEGLLAEKRQDTQQALINNQSIQTCNGSCNNGGTALGR